jgi:dihydroflavonol-4-reductase
MPGVLEGGLPLAHVSDIVRGHILAMEKGKKGERYIITGRKEDNLFQKEMAQKIAEVLQQKEPQKEIKRNFKVFPPRIAKIGAFFSELYSKIFNKPCLLSRAMIKAASYPSFYSNEKAKQELEYAPQYSFENAVEDMYEYYKKIDYFSKKTRQIDEK